MKLIIVENLIINFNNVTFMNIDVLKDNVLGIRVFYNCPNKEGGMQVVFLAVLQKNIIKLYVSSKIKMKFV